MPLLSTSSKTLQYNENVYGQIFATSYQPEVMLYEDIAENAEFDENGNVTERAGYYRTGVTGPEALKVKNPQGSMLIDDDAAPVTIDGKVYGAMAYTLDVDGNLNTLNDQELYLISTSSC